jgi:hypothetical protein
MNVRIKNNYDSVEYWDGRDWWMMGIHEALDAMTGLAICELEYCADWSSGVPDGAKQEFEEYMLEYYRSPDLRASVREQITEVLIRPFPQVRE